MNDIRTKIIAAASSAIGLDANPAAPDQRQRYIDLIAPGESASAAAAMAKESGCALVVAGLWRAAGVKDAQLDPPYRVSTAVTRLIKIAHTANAWIPFAANSFPEPGDMVLVGDNGKGGIEHVFTVMAIQIDEQRCAHIDSVDGGQRDAKQFETILAKSRSWKGSIDTVPGESRQIMGWINTSLLPA